MEKAAQTLAKAGAVASARDHRKLPRGKPTSGGSSAAVLLPYRLVTENTFHSIRHDVGDWPRYYRQYPGAQGILTLSRVGFSPDGEQALFYVSNVCGGLCATGSFVVAQRHETKWAVIQEMIVWVS